MISLPLTSRELTVAGRREVTYWARVGVAGFAFVAIALLWMIEPASGDAVTPDALSRIGGSLFFIGHVVQALVVYAGALLLPVAVVQSERDQRTLELLLLADRRGWDIVLSKYVSCVLQLWLLIVSVMPVLAFASYFGGVDVPRVAMQTANFCVMAAAFTAIGMMCASWARDAGRAYSAAAGLFVGWVAVAWVVDVLVVERFFASESASTIVGRIFVPFAAGPYVLHTFLFALVTVLVCLGIAAWRLPNVANSVWAGKSLGAPITKPREVYDTTLFGALIWRQHHRGAGLANLFEIMVAFVFGLIPVLGWLLVGGLCIRKITGAVGRLRKEGLLDEVLLTPGGTDDVYTQMIDATVEICLLIIIGGVVGAAVSSIFVSPFGFWTPFLILFAGMWMNSSRAAALNACTRPLIPAHQEATAIGRMMVALFLWALPVIVVLAIFANGRFLADVPGVHILFFVLITVGFVWIFLYPMLWTHGNFERFKKRVHLLVIAEPSYAETMDFRREGVG